MLVYIPGDSTVPSQRAFVWVDRDGKARPLDVSPNNYYDYFKISPDGTHMAQTIVRGGEYDIYIQDLVRGPKSSRLTFGGYFNTYPIWTPNGQRIIFSSSHEGRRNSLYWKRADGGGKEELIAPITDGDMWPTSISSDRKIIFFGQRIRAETGGYNIGMISLEEDQTPKLLLQEKYNEYWPQISPDGRWLAYVSDETHRNEVYIRPFPEVDSGGQWQVSTNGGEFPLWSHDGRELFYLSPDAIMVVSVETDSTLKLGRRKSLFLNKYIGQFDIDPDDKKFLMIKPLEATEDGFSAERPRKINIVLNWFEELKEKVPVE